MSIVDFQVLVLLQLSLGDFADVLDEALLEQDIAV